MKTLAILLLAVSTATALTVVAPFNAFGAQGRSAGGALGAGGATGGAVGAGGAAAPPTPVNYGPKVYGAGANNIYAMPPHPFVMQRAVAIANSIPNLLVRLDIDGEVTLTNQFGQDVDQLVDQFGREIDLEL
ncbi:uncharacterized protein LOC123510079 [Portunus trituberculatus]|uniref:uncharacterized protein LOC123510079 n=1 Tax=Portunus trituberculatus TaxID=210409 RepID=UPI001E1CC33E|nr:uncharacterized protein LOC123510079 [Portunus trituberculatus]